MAAPFLTAASLDTSKICVITPGNYDTDTLIEVLGELRRFLRREGHAVMDGYRPIAARPCGPGWRTSGPGCWSNACRPTRQSSTRSSGCGVAQGKPVPQPRLPTLHRVVAQAELGIERARRTPHLAYSFLRRTSPSVS
jgi:hypothetical protein